MEDMVGGNTIEQGYKLNSRNAFLKEVSILNSDLTVFVIIKAYTIRV